MNTLLDNFIPAVIQRVVLRPIPPFSVVHYLSTVVVGVRAAPGSWMVSRNIVSDV